MWDFPWTLRWQTLVSVIYYKMGRCSFLLFSFITLFSLINEGCAIAEHRQEDWKSKLAPWLAACRDVAVSIQGGSRGRAVQLLSFFPQELFLGFSFISSKTTVTGEGGKGSRRLKVGSRNGNA